MIWSFVVRGYDRDDSVAKVGLYCESYEHLRTMRDRLVAVAMAATEMFAPSEVRQIAMHGALHPNGAGSVGVKVN